ncbi:hypothetical protein [Streptomyces sp. S.PB5]|uniref:hypothetical protein n=1 Tax=Streptomyces sp. S.PB5 TaxID=3020844 RepID=UPI0025B0A0DE|nr:hypothetical protein [Streptomyces sp. S.PB5]MDN3026999.1 hypothetical protein [Streptomyces sp. S.PB5]
MRTRITRTVALLLVPLALAMAGCGSEHGSRARIGDSESRAQKVADAWDGSRAAEVWREGYYPMADVVQLPDNAFRNEADKMAYGNHSFVLDGELPTTSPETGKVEWRSGGSLTLPLMGAQEAYDTIAPGGHKGPHLTVTKVELGRTTLVTSRGPATVPAWLFTLKGYDTPLKRVALAPSELPKSPIGPARETPTDWLMPLEQFVRTGADGRSVTVLAGHGACDDGPVVRALETAGSVVLSAAITGANDGSCTSQLLMEKVTVKLDRELGDRVLLDAFTGAPVTFGHRTEHG